jgi:hypothetical protein
MEKPGTERKIELRYLEKSLSYETYLRLVEELLAAGKSTGPHQSAEFLHYSKLNIQRTHRVEKTMRVLPEVAVQMGTITRPQTWLVLSEGWCGDASQSLPVMRALANLNPRVRLCLLLRDENLELMDRYLTNGVSRSIPKLIAVEPGAGMELFTWGPRPAALQESFYGMRSEGLPHDVITEELQRWYNKDKTMTVQRELAALATGTIKP